MKNLTFSFDIGYASIGWAVLKDEPSPQVVGTGVVLFPSDDCLASKRRVYRRMRRTIRSRRQRIDRIGKILEHYGVITPEERHIPGHPAPFILASQALGGEKRLSGLEVWHLMRWYAHNRGYDGNSRWASKGDELEAKESSAREKAAVAFMEQYGTHTMSGTIVRMLKLDDTGKRSTVESYKKAAAAFPRAIVEKEVERVLSASDVPAVVCKLIIGQEDEHREELAACGIRLPKRYCGSVLFGQLVPRFDNRIIARCPLTWAKEYAAAKEGGSDDKTAKARADKYAKVPKADCKEFYEYRFARILANIRVDGRPLSAEHRVALMDQGREKGGFSITEFKKAVKTLAGDGSSNLENYFELHPDSKNALIVVPKNADQKASGRAPYARPVLVQVVEEVLRGEDPNKPARSIVRPDGEEKEQDGVLYPLLDPLSDVSRLQGSRRVEDMTNNHLVRHRMLIFERLLRDMVREYADGCTDNVERFCIEVGRELKEFSGLTAKEIASKMTEAMRSFHAAVKKIQKDMPEMPISAKLIRKCRIAMDLNWKCPFTGKQYSVADLPKLEMEHVVPFANRRSSAMASLVLTWPEVNRIKGKRTGLQFISECSGQYIDAVHANIVTVKQYEDFVKKLDTRGAKDDQARKKTRKRLMMVGAFAEKDKKEDLNVGFTDGMMTQSSQLMKIAGHVARRVCPKAQIAMIPGSVTAAVRCSWKAMGAMVKAVPEIVDPDSKELREKEEIRGITHLHHALDACVLGLIPLLIPAGTNGIVWQALGMRNLTEKQVQQLRQLGVGKNIVIEERDQKRRLRLQELPSAVMSSIRDALCEERVAQHVPADMSGAKLEEKNAKLEYVEGKYWEVVKHAAEDGEIKLKRKWVNDETLVGVRPLGKSKLNKQNSVIKIRENFSMVIWLDDNTKKPTLQPTPVLVPHHCVYKRLRSLYKEHDGKSCILLRKGQLIRVWGQENHERNRIWRVEGMDVSNGRPRVLLRIPTLTIKEKKLPYLWTAYCSSLISEKSGIEILPNAYIGYARKRK